MTYIYIYTYVYIYIYIYYIYIHALIHTHTHSRASAAEQLERDSSRNRNGRGETRGSVQHDSFKRYLASDSFKRPGWLQDVTQEDVTQESMHPRAATRSSPHDAFILQVFL